MKRRHSIRLSQFDYRARGAYFVTICSHERDCLFVDERLIQQLRYAWTGATKRQPAETDFVVMPNHVHGIVWLTRWRGGNAVSGVRAQRLAESNESTANEVGFEGTLVRETGAAPLHRLRDNVPVGAVGSVVRTFKSQATRRVADLLDRRGRPVWQRNYWEHIVRDEAELARIRRYILDNPAKWAEDPNHPALIAPGIA